MAKFVDKYKSFIKEIGFKANCFVCFFYLPEKGCQWKIVLEFLTNMKKINRLKSQLFSWFLSYACISCLKVEWKQICERLLYVEKYRTITLKEQ